MLSLFHVRVVHKENMRCFDGDWLDNGPDYLYGYFQMDTCYFSLSLSQLINSSSIIDKRMPITNPLAKSG